MPWNDDDIMKAMCTLAEHTAVLRSIVAKLDELGDRLEQTENKLEDRLHVAQQCLMGRIDRLDERLRATEKISATYGTVGGSLMSTLISLGLNLTLRSHQGG